MTRAAHRNRRKTDSDESEAYVHRRSVDGDAVLHLHGRVADCEESIVKLLESNQQMSATLQSLTFNLGRVAEVLEAWNSAKGFWMMIKFMSAFARVVLPILGIAGAIWVFVKTGIWQRQ